jgi:transposase-like protein
MVVRAGYVERARIVLACAQPGAGTSSVAALGIGDATVARAWRRYHVQPWRRGTFKFSTDPERDFLRTVAKAYPRRRPHVVLDNHHRRPERSLPPLHLDPGRTTPAS